MQAIAGHIAGGEMYYQYLGTGTATNSNKYQITLRLFRECHPLGQAAELPDIVRVAIFRNSAIFLSRDVSRSSFDRLSLNSPLTCILHPPEVCYQVAVYSFTAELPVIPEEYIAAYQTCCRSNSILNVQQFAIPGSPRPGEGSTYTCNIPGTATLAAGHNSSAVFSLKDTVLICANKKINIDFSATDPDGDSLSYSFCTAYNRGASTDANIVTPSAPSYTNVTYKAGYSGGSPLGTEVIIDPVTGRITGRAPSPGVYVVNVCVTERRGNLIVSTHRKDFIVRVSDCDFAAAELDPVYTSCDGFTVNFANESTSTGINAYYWDFGTLGDTSTVPLPQFTYKDTGTYDVKLVVNRGQQCSDSANTLVKVYPGFKPDFTVTGSCVNTSFQFKDITSTVYGVVDSWQWAFENSNTDDAFSGERNPEHIYSSLGNRTVQLIVTNSKGCISTITKDVEVRRKPTITLPFRDTLICKNDSLRLSAAADITAGYIWSPVVRMLYPATRSPVVYPGSTTTYIVSVDDGKGCTNTDSVKVNVVDHALLDIGSDTAICLTDTIQFHPESNALYFTWAADNTLSSTGTIDPLAVPVTSAVTYSLRASISSKCFADDKVVVRTSPYPMADAGIGGTICYGFTTQLRAAYAGSVFTWSPAGSLLGANTLTPVAGPQTSTIYTLTAKDTSAAGCAKPVSDTVLVAVIPPVQVAAGNDTNIVVTQPLELKATGAGYYQWGPATAMTNPESSNPIVVFSEPHEAVTYHVKGITAEGCAGYDTVTVFIYKTLPEIFIPSAFTPNGDGLNDKLIPVVAGIKKLEGFSVYNRWGQLLYSTAAVGQGWDGTVGGNKQPAGTYIYMAKAIDYLGKTLIKKGSVVLIR